MKPFITQNEAVAFISSLFNEKDLTPQLRNKMKTWIYLGERQLGYSGVHEKTEENIVIKDLSLRKPNDYAVGIDLAIFDSEGCEVKWLFKGNSKRIHSSESINKTSPRNKPVYVYEDPYYFNFGGSADNLSCANLKYYSYPIDEEGDLLIPEHHIQALIAYVKWSFAYARNENQSEIQLANQRWTIESRKAKSKNKIPSMLQGSDIARLNMSMIHKDFKYN